MKRLLPLLAALLWFGSATRAEARATFQLVEGGGLDDPTVVAPVGGNAGRTLGAQRRAVVERALTIWGSVLDSPVPIRVFVTFTPMRCTDTGATLGGARPVSFFPLPDPARPGATLLYPSALADRLAGSDLDPNEHDVYIEFNASLDVLPCSGRVGLYYGLDGAGTGQADLLTVTLHEIAHGLGICSTVDVETGELPSLGLDVFSSHIHDLTYGRSWPSLSADERSESLTHVRQLVFDGAETQRAATRLLARGDVALTLSPPLAGFTGEVASSDIPPPLASGVARGTVRVIDGAELCRGAPRSYAGMVLLFDAGTADCGAWAAIEQAAQQGAVGALLLNNMADIDFPALPLPQGPSAPPIPVLTLATRDALLLARAAQEGAMEASLDIDPAPTAGADPQGRPFLFASIPAQPGSSISHFDPLVRPDLLMEPYSTDRAKHDLDLTVALMRDLGWTSLCGNGRLDGDEQCDAGDANSDAAGASCRMGCRLPACGDGVVDPGEACDRGVANSDSEPDACRTDCTLPACGDGVVDRGESCDGSGACTGRCLPGHVPAFGASEQAGAPLALDRDATDGCSLGGRGIEPPWAWLSLVGVLGARRRRARR